MILALIVIVLIIQKCTVLDLSPLALVNKNKYTDYKYLHEGVRNPNTEIVKVSDTPYNTIGYDEKHNYFVVYSDDHIHKINSAGVEIFKIAKHNTSFTELGPYIFENDSVYDLTEKYIGKTEIKEVIPFSIETHHEDNFTKLLEQYYHKASAVYYANVGPYGPEHLKIYLKTANTWTLLNILKKGYTFGESYGGYDNFLKAFPEKYQRYIYLKNPVNQVYSSRNAGSETFSSIPDDITLTMEDSLEYPEHKNIKVSYFKKQKVASVIAYTGIPVSFSGPAYINIKISGNVFKVKEMGHKSAGISFGIQHFISYYMLPKNFEKQSNISFLKIFPSASNLNSGSEGLYVIRPLLNKII
ncbi:hypothetical protein JJL45_03910 [Tamlana sp. s12]|uniref:hypothetical protein n=1 Tax=Tamlana sp. s12 TaxID=1630406 RepID=UPI00192AFE43|nr:hypothetical protein [Tamlana sp. s12]QQY83149.1 hypothetical protein JJL45_03910 [Tamlana sp. s12]